MAAKIAAMASSSLANVTPGDRYVSYTDPKVEPVIPDEEQKMKELLATVQRVLNRHFATHRHQTRVTHVKTQAIVKGTLKILPDLPSHLAQSMFKTPGVHAVALRFANEPIHIQDDREPGPRGVSMKIFNVDGTFLDPNGQKSHTQDMTFNNAPMLELTDLPTTLEIFQLRERYYNEPEQLKAALKKRSDSSKQLAPQSLPNQHFLSYVMYSQSAYRFGDYVAKYALFPTTELQKSLANSAKITSHSYDEQHSIWLQDYFRHNDAEYDLRVQLLVSPTQQSVEDTSVPWDETAFPFETIGKVCIPKGQNAFDPHRRTFWDDRMKLNVWYGLETLQPLGSVNRLRKALYELSSKTRAERNAVSLEVVSSIEQIP